MRVHPSRSTHLEVPLVAAAQTRPSTDLPPGQAAERASGSIAYPVLGTGPFLAQILAMIAYWSATRGG